MIASITPFTALDFDDKLACIFWFASCNLRCRYCYNGEFLTPIEGISTSSALGFLASRIGLLEGVVLSGGECTIYGEKLIKLSKEIKALGFAIKLDHNGTNPTILSKLLENDLLDYVALDYKAPSEKYTSICGVRDNLTPKFWECFTLLQNSGTTFEVRTTFHSDLLSVDDVLQMHQNLKLRGYKGRYFVQGFIEDKGSLGSLGASDNKVIQNLEGITYRGKI